MNPSTPISQAISTTKSHLKRLEDLGVKSIRDLLLYFPRTYEDKRAYSKISEISTDNVVNLKGKLSHLFHKKTKKGMLMTRAMFSDDSGSIEVIWFNQPYLKRLLKN
jgi:ATP-dependent DNA helicase RecG